STDNIVVGAFLSVGLVAFYSIGGSLTVYSMQVVSSLSTTFTPLASGLDALGKTDELRRLLMRGTQAVLGLSLPISLALLFRGKTFIGLWMGHSYREISGNVLEILIISQFFTVANNTASNIMFAIGKHKAIAKAASIEAALNLGLSILLVKNVGIYGVAWGTSISMAVVHLIFWPRYVRKILGIPMLQYLWQGWGKMTLAAVPYAAVCAIEDIRWHPASLAVFFVQIGVTLPIYIATVLLVFHKEAMTQFRKWQQSRLVRASA
ncbi:MAG: polysaccharide biosynthesis C-terminal domain-containing protein, partial [Acidobacteriaceae bacterium]